MGRPRSHQRRRAAAPDRDRRGGLRRDRPRDQAARGGDRDVHDPREGRLDRRRVARQHVPGPHLRHPVAPLLAVVRAQPRLVAPLCAARRDPRLPGAPRHQARAGAPHPPRHGGRARRLRRGRGGLARHDRGRRGSSRPTSSSARPASSRGRRPLRCPDWRASTGPSFHSSRWDDDVELAGKRVAVVGTGASAISSFPRSPSEVEQLYVFQRSAPWVVPKNDREYSQLERRLFRRLPALQRLNRRRQFLTHEVLGWAVTRGRRQALRRGADC